MKNIKKLFCFLTALGVLPSLGGCGTIYSNYREVEQILVIQTMGLDYLPGGVRLSLASGSNKDPKTGPICLSGTGESITTAMDKISNYSYEDELFFSHINHVLIGEEAAKHGIDSYLSYICRSPELRIDIPLYITKGGSAGEIVAGVGNDSKGISEVLQAAQETLRERGESHIFTAAEILRNIDRYGSTLVCAVEHSTATEEAGAKKASGSESGAGSGGKGGADAASEGESGGSPEGGGESGGAGDPQGEGGQGAGSSPAEEHSGKTAAIAGYAILKGDRLCGYIDVEDALGIGFLLNDVGITNLVIKDDKGAPVTLEIAHGRTEVRPIWEKDGSLSGIDVSAKVNASVLDIGESGEHSGAGYTDFLTSQLEAEVSERISRVLQLSRRLGSDFLGLASRVEKSSPVAFRAMNASFEESLPALELCITVSGELSHTNDIKDSLTMNVNTEYHFNRNQLLALGTVMLLSPALRLFPSASAALAGRGAWLSPLMAVPFLLAYICFISRLMNARREGEGLAELGLRCFGKKAGKIILAIMLLWLLLYSGFVLRSGADRLITTIYPYSSPPFFIIIMGLICMIAALGSARAIVRMAKLIQPVVLGVLLLVLVFALFSADFTNLLPLTVYDALPVMKGALPAINVIVVIVYLVCFLGGLKPNEPHRFRQYSVWMLLMSLLLTALSVAVVGSFGAELTARLTRPFFSLVRNLIFFRSIERMESLVVALWIFPDFLLVSLLFYSAQHCLRLILGVKKPDYNGERFFDMSGKRWVIPLCAAVSVSCGALMAPDPIILDLWSEKLIPLINYIFAFIFIPIIYIVGKIKKAL